jgi:uncharacterized membrane protein YhaH (DUF805 family)
VRRVEKMSFGQAIQTCLRKYTDFEGRASRSECWWFILFISLIAASLNAVNLITPNGVIYFGATLAGLWSVAMLLPTLAVAVRRLRDAGRRGIELLWLLIPVAGPIIVIIHLCQPPELGELMHTPGNHRAA